MNRITTVLLLSLLLPLAPAPLATGSGHYRHVDEFPSAFQASFELLALSGEDPTPGGAAPLVVAGYGPTTVLRSDPYPDPETGKRVIDTEIVDMQLFGTHPVLGDFLITESPTRASVGRITDVEVDQQGNFLGGVSTFDVFFEAHLLSFQLSPVLGNAFHNLQPFQMGPRPIGQLPPVGEYYHPTSSPVALWGTVLGGLRPVGYAVGGCHGVLSPSGGGSHGLCVTTYGKRDPSAPGCFVGPVFVRVSDASQPAHTLVMVAGAATPPPVATATLPWTDLDGDQIFETAVNAQSPSCIAVSLTATGTFSDTHTATRTVSWMQRL